MVDVMDEQKTEEKKVRKKEAKVPSAPKAEGEEKKIDETAPQSAPEVKTKKKKKEKKAPRVFVARGKRKLSIARATIKAGKGVVRINRMNISAISNSYIREIVREPLRYIGPEANTIDLNIDVHGGGTLGQAQAARTAIAHALVLYFDQMNLKEKFASVDRSLLIEDTRRVESKKYRGPKARARFQKSYR